MTLLRYLLSLLVFHIACPALAASPDVSGHSLTPIAEKTLATDFNLPDIDGKTHRLSSYRGKVVIVNFWATWCPPCREEMPALQRAWNKVKGSNIVLLAVDVGESEDEIFTFTGDYPVDFPLLMDTDSAVIGSWPIRGLPTTFVVDPEGRLVYRAIGGRAWDSPEILNQIRALLK